MKDLLMIYRNYLASLQYRKEYGDKYGDTEELIEMYERELNMKEPCKHKEHIENTKRLVKKK